MTDYRIDRFPFDAQAISFWAQAEQLGANWPVVYTLSNDKEIYGGGEPECRKPPESASVNNQTKTEPSSNYSEREIQ
jgi:hypothetical protein